MPLPKLASQCLTCFSFQGTKTKSKWERILKPEENKETCLDFAFQVCLHSLSLSQSFLPAFQDVSAETAQTAWSTIQQPWAMQRLEEY